MKAVVKVPLDFVIEGVIDKLTRAKNILHEVILGIDGVNAMSGREMRELLHEAETRIEDACKILNGILEQEADAE